MLLNLQLIFAMLLKILKYHEKKYTHLFIYLLLDMQ